MGASVERGTAVEGGADERLVEQVKERYGRIAESGGGCSPVKTAGSCCGSGTTVSLQIGYRPEEQSAVPASADLGLGCGAPIAHLGLARGETVLDLGSGAGFDAFLAARAVGPSGRVIGVDMTPAMLARARSAAAAAGYDNVEFREGRLEALPVADASVDAVTSNCVVNLVPNKALVFQEIARVLKPGGRLVISDIVLDGPLPAVLERDVYAYVGCIAGAALRTDYFHMLEQAGLSGLRIIKDVDYAAALLVAAPEEVDGLLARHGLGRDSVLGRVRSLTFRAERGR